MQDAWKRAYVSRSPDQLSLLALRMHYTLLTCAAPKNSIFSKVTVLKFHARANELHGGYNGDIAGVLYSFIDLRIHDAGRFVNPFLEICGDLGIFTNSSLFFLFILILILYLFPSHLVVPSIPTHARTWRIDYR